MLKDVTTENVQELVAVLNRAAATASLVHIMYRHVPDANGVSDELGAICRWILPIPVREEDGQHIAVVAGRRNLFVRAWDLHAREEKRLEEKSQRKTKFGTLVADLMTAERCFAIAGIEAFDDQPHGPIPVNYVYYQEIVDKYPQVRAVLGLKRKWEKNEETGKSTLVYVTA